MNPLRAAILLVLCAPAPALLADDSPAAGQLAAPSLIAEPAVPAAAVPVPGPIEADGNASPDWNVNSRYTVESVEFTDTNETDFSHRLRQKIDSIAGDRLNPLVLKELARDIKAELNAHTVSFHIARGSRPDCVRVFFDVDRSRSTFDVSVPKFFWQSNEGWTASGDATLTVGATSFTVGLLSDADDLVERFTGVRARVTHRWGNEHPLRLVFDFEDYHEEYTPQTVAAAEELPGIPATYHARRNLAPRLEYRLAREVTVSAGTSFESLQSDLAPQHAASANSMTAQVRWHHQNETSDDNHKTADASWSIRASTHTLGSDYVYTRNEVTGSWTGNWGPQSVEALLDAGMISGQAPLFERFALGNSTMLRGWNKYDLDPIGGSRVAYGSVEYRYRILRAFYDVGAIWDPGQTVAPKQSVGAGVGSSFGILGRNELLVALAFPLRAGRMDPVFIAGMNF